MSATVIAFPQKPAVSSAAAISGCATASSDDEIFAGVVAAFDLATGERRWRADLGDPVVGLFRGEGQLVAMRYGWKGGGPEPEITHSRELEDGISVITTVGCTLLTRMPCSPSSSALTRVMLSTAAFEEP